MIDLDILVILDRSGSMQTAAQDHEGGLRSFVEDQRSLPGDVRFTLVQFDSHDPFEVVYDRVPLDAVADIRLVPRGGTPLYGALGRALSHLDDRQRAEPSDRTVVMVITDGQDTGGNGEWTRDLVKARLKVLEARQWSALFLGANIDAFSEASGLGIAATTAMNFANTSKGVHAAYAATTSNMLRSRSAVIRGAGYAETVACLSYTVEQRAEAVGVETAVTGAAHGDTITNTSEKKEQ